MATFRLVLLAALCSVQVHAFADAQCRDQWLPGLWLPNGQSPVRWVWSSTMWDPDGAGPTPAQLAVGSSVAGAPSYGLVATWDPTTGVWRTIGSTNTRSGAFTLTPLPNGDLVVGGSFTQVNGVAAERIARYDGRSWHPLGAGSRGGVYAPTVLPNGDLLSSGGIDVGNGRIVDLARWDGSSWSAFGSGELNSGGTLAMLETLSNGNLVAGGSFDTIDGVSANNVAIYANGAWSALGSGVNSRVHCLTELPNGDLVIGGAFGAAGGIATGGVARWNGSAWSAMGTGPSELSVAVRSLAILPASGDVIAAGDFRGHSGVNRPDFIARWNGSRWTDVAQGPGLDDRTRTVTVLPNGDLVAGGTFSHAGGNPSHRIARLVTSCAADVRGYGAACPSSGGANTLTAITRPWAGTTFRARGEGLPIHALVAVVTGFSPDAIALSTLLPQGQLGCSLLATTDILSTSSATTAGIAESRLPLPNAPWLAGLSVYHQMVVVEPNAGGGIRSLTSTNGLQLTIAPL